jgi:ABC-type dipeptide/oligopeptide/nickel transport system ATPase component
VEQGDADTVFAYPREDYTRALMAAAFALEEHAVLGNTTPSGL